MTEPNTESTTIEIECQGCSEENSIDFQRSIPCKKCAKPITGKRYKLAPLGLIPFLFGIASYDILDRTVFSEDRYPLQVEYSMVDACINSDQRPISRQQYSEKQTLCLCAVEKTIEDYSYSNFRRNQQEFPERLRSSLTECT